MFPIICKIGPLTVYSYGLMLAIAVLVCSHFLSKEAPRLGIQADVIIDLIFWIVLGGIIGARIFYIILNLQFFLENPLEMIMVQKGGLAWQGGLILGSLTGVFYITRKKLNLPQTVDLLAPYAALGQAIGRVGCFLNGCCYGQPVEWGIYSPVHQGHLHPTQLYCMTGLLIIFFILKNRQKSAHFPGEIFILYLILASTLRFVVEFFRADHTTFILGLSIFQTICFMIITVAAYAYTRFKSHPRI